MKFNGHRQIHKPDGSTENAWHAYMCGHCNSHVSGAVVAVVSEGNETVKWLFCPKCANGSVLTKGQVFPGVVFGPSIQGLSAGVDDAYTEARRCLSVNAFTACELLCRKILMHVSVEKGAEEGKSFAYYLSHLEGLGFVTPPMKGWVDLIRQHGNKATHLLESPSEQRARSTLVFTAELLRLIYEMEFLAKKYSEDS